MQRLDLGPIKMGTKRVQIEMMILEQDGCERFQERGLMLTPLAILYAGSLKNVFTVEEELSAWTSVFTFMQPTVPTQYQEAMQMHL